MVEQQQQQQRSDANEFYSRMSRSWFEGLNSWAKMAENLYRSFGGTGPATWYRPYSDYMESWNHVFGNFSDLTRAFFFPFSWMRDISELTARNMDTYTKLYYAWLEGFNTVAREAYQVGSKIASGEEVEARPLFDAMRTAYNTVTDSVVDSLQNTPFAGITQIDSAIKKSLDSFPDETETVRDFWQLLLNFSVKTTNLSISALKNTAQQLPQMLQTGNIPVDSYYDLIDAWGQTINKSLEVLRVPGTIRPAVTDMSNQTVCWAKASLDLYASWLEMNTRMLLGIPQTIQQFTRGTDELMGQGAGKSADEFYRISSELAGKTANASIQNTRIFESMPKYINKYTEWVNATTCLYQSMLNPSVPPAYATREELSSLAEDMEKMRKPPEARAEGRRGSRARAGEERESTQTTEKEPTPIEVKEAAATLQIHLAGVDYPADKQKLIDHAKSHGAPDSVIWLLEKLPDTKFEYPTDVQHEVSKVT